MTDIEFTYYSVMHFDRKRDTYERFIDGIVNDFSKYGILNFGKILIPIGEIQYSIHDVLFTIISKLNDSQIIDSSFTYLLFKVSQVIFNATWRLVDGEFIEVMLVIGTDYEISDKGVFVFSGEDDNDTVVPEFDSDYDDIDNFSGD